MAQQIEDIGQMMYLHALSPVQCATGESVDVIDVSIMREQFTNWPLIPGSSIKGVLKEASSGQSDPKEHALAFGAESTGQDDHASGVWFSDARLLCLPVRSLAGSFAWITSPLVLQRWRKDYEATGLRMPAASIPIPAVDGILLGETAINTLAIPLANDHRVYLEDLDLFPTMSDDTLGIAATIAEVCFPNDPAWQSLFVARFGIVHDDTYGFLTETATQVNARIRLKEHEKTVAQGGLWYEESLPAESILTCPVVVSPQGAQLASRRLGQPNGAEILMKVVRGSVVRPVQIGGNASIGQGLVRIHLAGETPPR